MSTAPVAHAGFTMPHDRKPRNDHNHGPRTSATHDAHLPTDWQTDTAVSPTLSTETKSTTLTTDPVILNPQSILPTTKSTKSLHHLQKHSLPSQQGAVASTQAPSERIDDCSLERNQTSILQSDRLSPSDPDKAPFIAFGIKAYPTRAVFDDICYDFVRSGRWCSKGSRCLRIHPINKEQYLATVIRESIMFSRMRAKRRADQGLTPSGTSFKREKEPYATTSLNTATTASPDTKNPTPSPIQDSVRVKLPAAIATVGEVPTDHADTWMAPQARDVSQSRSLVTHERQDQVARLAASDLTFRDDSRSKEIRSDPEEEVDNPWKDVRPKWHTDSDEEEYQSDKESGYWSNSNETATPSRDPSACSISSVSRTSGPNQWSPSRYNDQLQRHCHPRRVNERCRRWLRGQCDKGYSCLYIHEDLEYDNGDSQDSATNTTAIVVLRRGPETMFRTLHHHVRATFAAGFRVAELSTGFESFCIIIEGLVDMPDSEILELLKPFGKVRELRRPINFTSKVSIRVYFEKTCEAFAALVALHGKKISGRTLDVKPGNETNGNRLVFRGNAVRFEWDAPSRTVYMGYSTRRLAEQAVDEAEMKSCGDFMSAANIHVGIPAVGAVTVRFRYVPLDMDQDRMKTFGPHEGMVTGKPNFKYTTQDMIRGLKAMLKSRKSQITEVDVGRPPYRNGKMKAWIVFANSRDAQNAAASFHGKEFMGGTTISAYHVKSISFALTPLKYQMVRPEICALRDRLLKDDKGYSINVRVGKDFVTIQISGDEIKVLGRLKVEFERILNGEQVYDNGKVVWDPIFGRPEGREVVDKLQKEYPGVTIIVSSARSSIRLVGEASKRAFVRKRVINFVNTRRARGQYLIPLRPDVARAFAEDKRDGFGSLEEQLGEANVLLDSWQNLLVVSGDVDAYTLAKDVLFNFRIKHQLIGSQWRGETCPACTGVASSAVKLPCGHSWCRMCLQHCLKSATERDSIFPLTCHGIGKRCGEPIPLVTAREVLTPDDFEALFHSAFSAHVLTRPRELHYCPTPDCPQVYRSTPEGIFMQCPECLCSICTHCHTEAHEGLTCVDIHDGDGLFWEWASGNDVKQCPKCKMAIEKAEGCNHMMCGMCQTHICWVCMETFENGFKIYGHMQSEHGGSGI